MALPYEIRKPEICPNCFTGKYKVANWDTMNKIAYRYGVDVTMLVAANPHIPDPDMILPGDILCVPMARQTPNVIELNSPISEPHWYSGIAYIHSDPSTTYPQNRSMTVTATLPEPEALGYDFYLPWVEFYKEGRYLQLAYGSNMQKSNQTPPTWTYRLELPYHLDYDNVRVVVGTQSYDEPVKPLGYLIVLDGYSKPL